MVDFRFNALSCFEASVAMQKQADAFRGACGKPPRRENKINAPAVTRRKRIVHNSFPMGSHLSR